MKNKKILSFTDLEVWKESHKLTLAIYRQTRNFPKEELFGISSQLRRASVSIVSNIAEGFSRPGKNDKIKFYYISASSISEVQAQLLLCRDLGYITNDDFQTIAEDTVTLHKKMNSLIRSIKK